MTTITVGLKKDPWCSPSQFREISLINLATARALLQEVQ
jgi:hypothetical protein